MKRTTITRRATNGQQLATLDGWEADIDGVPVVLCRDLGDPRRWICCEPRTGLSVSGRVASTREAVLTINRRQVEELAEEMGQSPASFLGDLVDSFLPTATQEG